MTEFRKSNVLNDSWKLHWNFSLKTWFLAFGHGTLLPLSRHTFVPRHTGWEALIYVIWRFQHLNTSHIILRDTGFLLLGRPTLNLGSQSGYGGASLEAPQPTCRIFLLSLLNQVWVPAEIFVLHFRMNFLFPSKTKRRTFSLTWSTTRNSLPSGLPGFFYWRICINLLQASENWPLCLELN